MKRLSRRSENRVGRTQPWPTWVFTAGVALALGVAWPFMARLPGPTAPEPLHAALLALGFALGGLVAIRFEFSGESHGATLSEVPLIIGLVFAPTDELLAAALAGSAAVAAWRRLSPLKAVFNVTTRGLETVTAALCFHALLDGESANSWRGWGALVVAVAAANLISFLCVRAVIALSMGRFDTSGLKTMAIVLVGVAAVNVDVGLLAVTVMWENQVAIVLLLGLTGVLGVGYRTYSELRRRHDDLQHVYQFSRAVEGIVEADRVINAVLSEAKTLLRCRVAELALEGPRGHTIYRLIGDGYLIRSVEQRPHPLLGRVTSAAGPVLVPRSTGDHDLAAAMHTCGFLDAVAAPVPADQGVVGTLVVADRLNDQVTFQRADVKLLEALAGHTAMALRSTQLLDQLRREVAAKDYQAVHDALTGLGNRTLFAEQVGTALAERDGESVVAVMLMDLDRFKDVNDTLGHHTGDVLLQQIADQLVHAVGNNGSVARLGGDEFAFVIPAVSRAAVAVVAAEILSGGQATAMVEGLRLEVRASLGVAIAPDHGTDRSTLLRHADVAMYNAKTKNTGVEVYQAGHDSHNTRRLVLGSEMRLAIESSSFELQYQPKAEMISGRVSGVEALLRWTHPLYGVIPPSEFIPLAEQSAMIRPLTLWALETALEQLATWHREGLFIAMAVNLSARSVFDAELAGQLEALLTRTHVPPSSLTLEITESSLFGDRPLGHTLVDDLDRLGVGLAIDDFGTGYSSFVRLGQLPVDEVKIDQSFVTDMLTNESHYAIVRSTIDLARNLKLRVVAEGVEDAATWARLGQLGCDAAQGYHLSEPLSGPNLGTWLRGRGERHLTVVHPLRRAH